MNAIFFVYLIGLVIAVFQDFKRREIDDWLNLFLLFSGILFVFLFLKYEISSFGFYLFLSAVVSFLFYFARIFSAGDAKLLFGISVYFYNLAFIQSVYNFGIFIILLLFSGSAYGLIYAIVLFFKNFKNTKKEFVRKIGDKRFLLFLLFGFVISIFGFYSSIFFILGFFIIFIILLFCVALSLEKDVLKFSISSKNIYEGDSLVRDIKIGGKVLKAGRRLTSEDAEFLNKKDLVCIIKDGVPYALSFLIAFLAYYFKDFLIVFLQ